ncbi:dipeptidyl aminopeptidase/acylaminoacyl peptidase [Lipingzhangella halophila]|uniref:Dipeptidyl aminopeptidase/acylaminoacyl peptidase n=1 Tax=Lipingzhangella halophila TaxID=1783352 RepID=A0A7W7W284_9ACTN|nr:prolyl oligopeptidase family serine peptidase [Lipingzhangella halophila]MBB4930509.1 dipeptidyl aminopeptidase/acylaminoacyl peptidase [Lipingzhangella halophila]
MRVSTRSYGNHPSQFAHLWLPDSPAATPAPVAVLLHGGWWRDRHGLQLMDPLAEDLVSAGWAVWNVEYRRTGTDGGGWPQTRDDVARALRYLDSAAAGLGISGARWGGRAVVIGHSAGGHLAMLTRGTTPLATCVVALAPVTDLERSAREGLGEGAVAPFLGPAPAPELYRASSPIAALPVGIPELLVHGDADQRVPVEHSRDYVAAARACPDTVDYYEIPGADHFAVIDPAHAAWNRVRTWLDTGTRDGVPDPLASRQPRQRP